MAYQSTFERYEMKYMLNPQQKQMVLEEMQKYMKLDDYGRTIIRNIYFDTENYRLIRKSLQKPVYKEKLRIRSYQRATPTDPVFVELKKKFDSIVYKRRLSLPDYIVQNTFENNQPLPMQTQIAKEIDYFRDYYENLKPAVFLTYEREAFYALDGSDFRITFDENILYRQSDISLGADIYGKPLLPEGNTLMEIKTSGGLPLWMSHILNKAQIYRTTYSKYGCAYQNIVKELQHA